MQRRTAPTFRGAAIVAIATVLAAPALAAAPAPARSRAGMVVTVDRHATEAGVEALRDGGNAVDGAVAAALVLAVTWPVAGNLGGGGFLLHRDPDGSYAALDFRETAPAAIDPRAFLDRDGRPIPGASTASGLAVGVPGSVAGLHAAHARWGRLSWPRVVAPAVRLARRGFPVSDELARSIAVAAPRLTREPDTAALFLVDGRPLPAGHLLVQRDLARTLRAIARHGPDGFYRGPVAEAVARTVRREGGVLATDDLAAYRVAWREPLLGSYRGHRVVTFPPPSSGGIVLLQILGMLERHDVAGAGFGSSAAIHLMVEAERRAYADRSRHLGDPSFHDVPVAELLDPEYLAARAAGIRADRATPSAEIRPGELARAEPTDTLHLSVTDAEGRAVALTTTLNEAFGAALVAEGTGVLLNNEMDDFALAPDAPSAWGLTGGAANAVAGGKRPLSSMSPTIVEPAEGGTRPLLVLGSPGGATIITSVLQVLVNVVDHGMSLADAVHAPRVHHQWLPDVVRHEPYALPADVALALTARGHALERVERLGNVNAIAAVPDGTWLGVADPRRSGSAAGP
jgi:gamma-glutamyltranspeptidase/glutathione hydrolase